MSRITLDRFLDGESGEPEMSGAMGRLRELLAQRPERAWRLAEDVRLVEKLTEDPAIEATELRKLYVAEIRRSLAPIRAANHARWSLGMLLLEWCLRGAPRFLLGLNWEQAVKFLRHDASRESIPLDAQPRASAVVELAVHAPMLGGSPPEDAALLEALRGAVRWSIGQLGFATGDRRTKALCVVALLRCFEKSRDRDEEPDALKLLRKAGNGQEILDRLRAAARDVPAMTELLAQVIRGLPESEELHSSRLFMGACGFLGFDPVEKPIEIQYEGKDPWIRRLLPAMDSVQPGAQALREQWRTLPEADQKAPRRDRCLEMIERARLLKFEDASAAAMTELKSLAPTAPSADRSQERKLAFTNHLLASAIGVHLSAGRGEVDRLLLEMGGERLAGWYRDIWPRFCASGRDPFPPKRMETDTCLALRPAGFATDPRFAPLGEDAAWVLDLSRKKQELAEVRKVGRSWLLQFVDILTHTDGNHEEVWDATLGILLDPDRRKLSEWRKARLERPRDLRWVRSPLSLSEELRMREAAARDFEHAEKKSRTAGELEDADGLQEIAGRQREAMMQRMPQAEQAHAIAAMNRCIEFVVHGGGASVQPPNGILAAFRSGDDKEFRRRLLGASVDLPVPVSHPGAWGVGSAVLAGLVLFVLASMLWQPMLGARPLAQDPIDKGVEPGWVSISDGVYARTIDLATIKTLFPGADAAMSGLLETGGNMPQMAVPMATEVVRRYMAKCIGNSPDGLRGMGAWADVTMRLPSTSEDALIRSTLKTGRVVHVGDPVEWRDRNKWGACVAVVQRQN